MSSNADEAVVTEAEPFSVPQHSLNRCPFCNVEIVPNDKLSNRITDRVSYCVGEFEAVCLKNKEEQLSL